MLEAAAEQQQQQQSRGNNIDEKSQAVAVQKADHEDKRVKSGCCKCCVIS